jgi:hypothetical protein
MLTVYVLTNGVHVGRNTSLFGFLASSKISMLTRAMFIRPDSELIRESVCACAKLFVDEENVLKSNRRRTKTLTDSTRNRHKKKTKQRCISFVLGYLRKILWKISTAISIKHRILATFNKKKSILTAYMPLTLT